MERVLKFVGILEYFLGPLSLMAAAKYPTLHVFGFNDKNAVFRDDDMINLGCTIGGGQRDVSQHVVFVFVQVDLGGDVNQSSLRRNP